MNSHLSRVPDSQDAQSASTPASPYLQSAWKVARRVVVFILGISVLIVGMVMIVSPGPAVVVIPLGLGILATEFLWARRILDSLKRRLVDARTAAAETSVPRWVRCILPKSAGDA